MGNVHQLRTPVRFAFEEDERLVEAPEPSKSRGLARDREDTTTAFGASAASDDPLASGLTVEAIVKWFNAEKSYGFVELTGGGGDAFVHLKTLRQIGRETLPSGAKFALSSAPGPEARRWSGLSRSTPRALWNGRSGHRDDRLPTRRPQ